MKKVQLYILSLITIVAFPVLAYLINYFFSDRSFWGQFDFTFSLFYQIIIGVLYGLIAGGICLVLIRSSWMATTNDKYSSRLRNVSLNYLDIVFISICAGVGEEILFRGAIQEFCGVIITSILFVAIHGYLTYKDWALSIYGFVMTIIIMGLGYIYEYQGVFIPIIAHSVIDIVLLVGILKTRGNNA
ncbi:MAG: CPBP family intramembrane metalloprotease [Crocinitomicaceae bacterium]|nr:CPBP family intramembrane metalloprotease [Crocinitomicaceae bacterium]